MIDTAALLANASPQGAALGGTVCFYKQPPMPCYHIPAAIYDLLCWCEYEENGRIFYRSLAEAMDALRVAVAKYDAEHGKGD